ncbi:MAG: hypothetical protein JNM09_24505 [Blastocatellia bacterium]|nr:hypothetical protein [Blastocatellia bacterium]
MKRFVSALLFLLIAAAFTIPATAQSPDKILKQATKSLTNGSGDKVLRNVRSWEVKGSVTRKSDGAAGQYQAASMLPNLYTATFDLRGLETSVGYSGKSGWFRDSRDGLRTLTGEASRDFQAEATFRNTRWLNAKKDKAKFAFTGPTNIHGKAANSITMTTAKNVRIKLHFDAASGLLLREEIPAGTGTRVFDYSDYRTVNGIQEAHAITATLGEEIYEIKLEQVIHNPSLNRAMFDFPKLSNEPLPDMEALLRDVKANEEKIDEILEKYTFTEKQTDRETDSTGQLREKKSETFELTFYKGNRIKRLIEKNGKPLSASELEGENKRLEKRIREIEKREAEKEKKASKEREVAQETAGTPDGERGQRISISDVLRASKLTNPRRERFRGRDVIVFDFEPLPNYKPQKSYEKFFGKTAGAIWVDANDKQVARVEARLVEAYKVGGGMLASLKEGATFALEQDRVNNEIWLPTRADINLSVKVLMIKGFTANSIIEYGNYKRFNVDAEKEKLKDPTAKPNP